MPIPAPLFLMLAWRKLTECNIADFLDSPQNPPPTAFWSTCHFYLALWLPPYPHLHDILLFAIHCIWYSPWYVSLLAGESLRERFWFQDPKSNILPRCWYTSSPWYYIWWTFPQETHLLKNLDTCLSSDDEWPHSWHSWMYWQASLDCMEHQWKRR